jgi:hypothetical protein
VAHGEYFNIMLAANLEDSLVGLGLYGGSVNGYFNGVHVHLFLVCTFLFASAGFPSDRRQGTPA